MLQPKNSETLSVHRRKVLLAGVDPSVQGLISTFLTTMGWTCTAVQNAESVPATLQQNTFDAVVIDLGPSEADAERAILSIEQIRPSLAGRILAISNGVVGRTIVELMERHDLIHLSQENLLPQLWATLQQRVASPRSRELAPRSMQVARMIFDSLRYPLPTGVRSLSSGARQLAYQHNKTIIDLSIDFAKESGRMSLTGQVLDRDKKGKTDQLSVVLVNGMGTLARTATNEFGEFYMECGFPQDISLEIRLAERSWVLVPLGKADWRTARVSTWQAET
jgi:CheY-like chemotaxis protein